MPKGKITEAHAVGTKINISFKPSEGNIAGTINITCPDGIVKTITPRHLNPLLAGIVAKKLIGTEWDIPLFGQMSKQQLKQDLKRRGLWTMKDNKMEINFTEKKLDGISRAYSDYWEVVEKIELIDRIDDLDVNGGKMTIFIKENAKKLDVVKAVEKLDFVEFVKSAKKVEVR